MSNQVGMWVDHRKAVIVDLANDRESVRTIESGAEKHLRLSGGSRSVTPWGPQEIASEQQRDRKLVHHLNQYYDRLIEAIRDAEAILIFGPGEAKGELKKRLEKSETLAARLVGVESADKMSEGQIREKVRKFFQE